ncbi:MAG TPA: prohibitin family protein [Candidatus Peribacteria bacterium]|nr:prohibitin family protein [Candidatus Peribacteria bacterium]
MQTPHVVRTIGIIAAVLVVLVVFFGVWPFVAIGAGERGVVLNFGAYNGAVMTPGLHLRIPVIQNVVRYNVQTQKDEVDASAASKDLQEVTAKIAVNYHIEPDRVGDLHKNIGDEYRSRVVDPAIQEAIKAATAQYTAEELITKRVAVKDAMKNTLTERLGREYITVEEVSIVNFSFSQSFNASIEAKVTAEQDALAAKNKLEQVKYEAQQQIETAKAQAESIKIQASAINAQGGADYVKLQAIQKWDGKLPVYMMGGDALINLPSFTK